MKKVLLVLLAALAMQAPAVHANSLIAAGPTAKIAKSSIASSPDGEWNKLSFSGGPNVEVWTRDGDNLNKVSFFGGVAAGMPIYREANKKKAPLPKVDGAMLLPDIPLLLESTYRARFQVNRMAIDSQDVTTAGGRQAIRFTYSYVRDEDGVDRKGEAIGTMVDKKLYLVTYEAPSIYYFGKDLEAYHKIVDSLKF
ncbi:putative uncharacterized protein precursor [Novosphingobium resinovorum]|uniref:DUF1795 domain-containing protein n=1 Tax=Novosphingobium resinovorum TaxID=158500 RepID=A0A031JZV9_9SPHN|nr:hypothetical protein [Novosphingobium resinovorum]EZP83266.1 putative uncharacterized protein precursor [Novosphingobium resinovorum]